MKGACTAHRQIFHLVVDLITAAIETHFEAVPAAVPRNVIDQLISICGLFECCPPTVACERDGSLENKTGEPTNSWVIAGIVDPFQSDFRGELLAGVVIGIKMGATLGVELNLI